MRAYGYIRRDRFPTRTKSDKLSLHNGVEILSGKIAARFQLLLIGFYPDVDRIIASRERLRY